MKVLFPLGLLLLNRVYAKQVTAAPETGLNPSVEKAVVELRSFTTIFLRKDEDSEELKRRWSLSIPSIKIPSISIPRVSIPRISIPRISIASVSVQTFSITSPITSSANVFEAASNSPSYAGPSSTAETMYTYSSRKSSSKLSRRAVVGIAIGGGIVLANAAVVGWFIFTKIRNRRKAKAAQIITQPPGSSAGNVLVKNQGGGTAAWQDTMLDGRLQMSMPLVTSNPTGNDMVVQIDGRETHRYELSTDANASELGVK
ncbi:hypothetical protein P154DRAFT_530885 [Amniculicola lignicola CBS 123094]|uniref:Mid2 domain-containing protein n=1 Tax=Amniculicola lignicola CBS 123094 TaxID=1392246 RepID=A0A6A5WWW1_9PLEO|nr:hypothetical protein P154DRAFT_530885 [Amniculicola lignicola CBS 123094]